MEKLTRAVLVGAGGFGAKHGKNLLDGLVPGIRLVAIVDPYANASPIYDLFKNSIPVYDRLEDFYAADNRADLVFVSTPHFLHYEHCLAALKGGSHVLCEKPLVPDLETLNRLETEVAASGKTLSVGFQWCCSSVIRAVKGRIMAGEFGKPVLFKSYTTWPRAWKYYRRNGWAGRIMTEDGQLVRDAIISNATSHHLQTMLFLLGGSMEESARLDDAAIETYRANDIESFDTCVLRGNAGGATVFYAATHSTNYHLHYPIMRFELEKATITISLNDKEGTCLIHHRDGRVEDLGNVVRDSAANSLAFAAAAAHGEGAVACSIQTVRPFTELMEAIFNRLDIHNFPARDIYVDPVEECTYVPYLHMELAECFNQGKLPSEMGFAWAKPPTLLHM